MRFIKITYCVFSITLFLLASVYTIGFFSFDLFQPQEQSPLLLAIINNTFFLLIFSVHHSLLARESIKRFIPYGVERATYILIASCLMFLIPFNFKESGIVLWDFQGTIFGYVLIAVSLLGWCIALISSLLIDPLGMYGVKQSFGISSKVTGELKSPYIYKYVRHPIYLGFIIGFMFTDVMTIEHLLFSVFVIVYIFIGKSLEEKDLIRQFGSQYIDYMRKVNGLLPKFKNR